MNREQLKKILDDHKEWLLDNTKGQRADLSRADLSRADLSHTEIFTFTLGQHFGFAHFGYHYADGSHVEIGCEGHCLDYWLKNFESIGSKHGYTKAQIVNYGKMLNMLNLIKLESDLAKMEGKK
jgi:uncharacterized protein YjbI with pentapeptide repeats